jgi:hypothetical protein
MCDIIHVLIFVTVSKCRKSPKLTNIVIERLLKLWRLRKVPRLRDITKILESQNYVKLIDITKTLCMFDEFHLTFNFKSKVSHDVFKNKNGCQLTSTFLLKGHLNVTCLVVCVISISKVSIDMWIFCSQVTLHVKI